MKNMVVASTSTLYGENYQEYLMAELQSFFSGCSTLVFIPFARPGGISEDDYTEKVAEAFSKINISIVGLHQFADKAEALQHAEGIFTGGGNTFLLVHQLHAYDLMSILSEVIQKGTRYLGTSAGSNITGLTMQTTNDMPIIYPKSFATLGLLPFNLNPHYIDSDSVAKHMGETRETRINEFHHLNNIAVVGLREGSWLRVSGNDIILKGSLTARLFRQNHDAVELEPETNFATVALI
ncbi:MAG TPA: dipeptidase PepE [Flavobacterium sp.]|jgi:dipeptidase E|nr:dipeptidase PepE [Flavobacterium sp.]